MNYHRGKDILPMGKNFRDTLNEQLQNSEFKAEWEALKTERQIMRASIEDGHSPVAERRAEQKERFPE